MGCRSDGKSTGGRQQGSKGVEMSRKRKRNPEGKDGSVIDSNEIKRNGIMYSLLWGIERGFVDTSCLYTLGVGP
jgi:hypothetical protein